MVNPVRITLLCYYGEYCESVADRLSWFLACHGAYHGCGLVLFTSYLWDRGSFLAHVAFIKCSIHLVFGYTFRLYVLPVAMDGSDDFDAMEYENGEC